MTNSVISGGVSSAHGAPGFASSVIRRCLALQDDAPPRSTTMRIIGRSPLSPAASEWYEAAIGELEVVRALQRMGADWTVFHAAGAGAEDSRVDHVLLGPGGVFTILVKAQVGRRLIVSSRGIFADGVKQPYSRIVSEVAKHASELIEDAVQQKIPVTPLIVVLGARSLTILSDHGDEEVVEPSGVARFFSHRPRLLTDEVVDRLTRVAALRGTLHRGADTTDDRVQLYDRFEQLQHQVERAAHIASIWASAGTLAALLALTAVLVRLVPLLETAGPGLHP